MKARINTYLGTLEVDVPAWLDFTGFCLQCATQGTWKDPMTKQHWIAPGGIQGIELIPPTEE